MPHTSAFDGLADDYRRHRPGYPRPLLRRLLEHLAPEGPLRVLDVGAGTGISTRALADALGPRVAVTGIEPGRDMRRGARADTPADRPIRYVAGTAEDLAAGDAAIDLVFTGQAVHWFDRPRFYAEAGRVLRPGGVLAIANNNRDWRRSAPLADYEAFLEHHAPGYRRDYRAFDLPGELAELEWVELVAVHHHRWTRRMTVESFLGMARSSTRGAAALAALGPERGAAELCRLLDAHAGAKGDLAVAYVSELVLAVRRA